SHPGCGLRQRLQRLKGILVAKHAVQGRYLAYGLAPRHDRYIFPLSTLTIAWSGASIVSYRRQAFHQMVSQSIWTVTALMLLQNWLSASARIPWNALPV